MVILNTGPNKEEVTGERKHIIRSFVVIRFTEYYSDHQIKEDEMGCTREKHGREQKYIQSSDGET
jgi:hypothetical protein